MAYTPKDGERFVSDEELTRVSPNERRVTYFSENTVFDFGQARCVVYQSSKGRDLCKIVDCLKDGKEHALPMSMLMAVPFQQEAALEITDFQKRLNACQNAAEVWNLVRGRRIKVVKVVEPSIVRYGETEPRPTKFSVWDWA